MSSAGPLVIQASGLSKTFHEMESSVSVLQAVDFSIAAGERVAIVGSSGSGKSTMLHLLGGLDKPTAGEVFVDGEQLSSLGPAARGKLRNRKLGFVYQFHHLLPEFSSLENVAIPLLIRGDSVSSSRNRSRTILERVGLADRLAHKPGEMSGGERQRAAIARALVTEPKCVLADEPTGNLDEQTAEQIYQLMLELNRELATSFVVVTHDMKLASRLDRVMRLTAGKLEIATDSE